MTGRENMAPLQLTTHFTEQKMRTECADMIDGIETYGRQIEAFVRPLAVYQTYALSCGERMTATEEKYGAVNLLRLLDNIDDDCSALEKIDPPLNGFDYVLNYAALLQKRAEKLLDAGQASLNADRREQLRFLRQVTQDLANGVNRLHMTMQNLQDNASSVQEWQNDVLGCYADGDLDHEPDETVQGLAKVRQSALAALDQGYEACRAQAQEAADSIKIIKMVCKTLAAGENFTLRVLNPASPTL
jgi:hypothetical protein